GFKLVPGFGINWPNIFCNARFTPAFAIGRFTGRECTRPPSYFQERIWRQPQPSCCRCIKDSPIPSLTRLLPWSGHSLPDLSASIDYVIPVRYAHPFVASISAAILAEDSMLGVLEATAERRIPLERCQPCFVPE